MSEITFNVSPCEETGVLVASWDAPEGGGITLPAAAHVGAAMVRLALAPVRPGAAMIAGIKGWLKQQARNHGYDIMRIDASGWYPYYLENLGFQPRTVVDVGVGEGTSVLYRTFPDAYHVLIEPLAQYEPVMQAILRRYRGEYHLAALGAREEERPILIDSEWAQRSSFLTRALSEGAPEPVPGRSCR
jgi:hypothetical protein